MANECYNCGAYDSDREGCTMPSCDKSYACPLEDSSLQFFLPMIPPTVTAQEHKVMVRNGKPVFYDPPEVKDAKDKLIASLYKHRPMFPYREGLRLIVKWCFPRETHNDGEYRITKPDTDNLQKMLKDCMTKCYFWQDDALVASELCEKFWAEIPGIFVRIEVLDSVELCAALPAGGTGISPDGETARTQEVLE